MQGVPSTSVDIHEDGKKILSEISKFTDIPIKNLWLLSAVLGKREGRKSPIQQRENVTKLTNLDDIAISIIISLYDKGDVPPSFLEAVKVAEEYAAVGVYILYNKFNTDKKNFIDNLAAEFMMFRKGG